MKKNNILLAAFFALSIAFSANAQVKIGSNPKVIAPDENLEVEATSGNRTIIMKSTGNVRIGSGIAAPETTLDVLQNSGGLSSEGYTNAVARFKTGGPGAAVLIGAVTGNTPYIGTNASFGLSLYTNSSRADVLYMHTNGNVMIGPQNYSLPPNERLEVRGNILASGTITPSDVRYKENITSLNGSLAKLTQLRGVSYTHKAEFIKSKSLKEGNQIGFIAQELEAIFPEFVVTSSDGYKAVDYARLTPVLVESLKEVNAKLEAQQAEINELKAAVKQLMEKK
jgi:Chaperone of endosialidase